MLLTRTSCKITHTNGYCGAWPEWAVSVSVLPLTVIVSKEHIYGKCFNIKTILSFVSFLLID